MTFLIVLKTSKIRFLLQLTQNRYVQVFSVDIVMSTGEGSVREMEQDTTVFKRDPEVIYPDFDVFDFKKLFLDKIFIENETRSCSLFSD